MKNLLLKSLVNFNKSLCILLCINLLLNSTAMANTLNKNSILKNTTQDEISLNNNLSQQNQQQYIPIDYTTINISDYKLAVMHVLYEICPNLINQEKHHDFNRNFKTKIADMLPNAVNPTLALNQLSTHKNYQQIFSSMKNETINNFSNDENKALCEDFLDYKSVNNTL